MTKEDINIDFYTTGRRPSEQEFVKISEWIKKDKEKQKLNKRKRLQRKSTSHSKNIVASSVGTAQHQQ